uniref:Uncharacterized protein n=1 Tax=Triticum urartu TaxID=4572 RepID=A0A8R7U6G3_TRIUA
MLAWVRSIAEMDRKRVGGASVVSKTRQTGYAPRPTHDWGGGRAAGETGWREDVDLGEWSGGEGFI